MDGKTRKRHEAVGQSARVGGEGESQNTVVPSEWALTIFLQDGWVFFSVPFFKTDRFGVGARRGEGGPVVERIPRLALTMLPAYLLAPTEEPRPCFHQRDVRSSRSLAH